MTRSSGDEGLLSGYGLLGKPGEGIVFTIDPDDRFPLAPGGHKGRWNSGNISFHGETLRREKIDEELGRAFFFQAQFRVFPDLFREFDQFLGMSVNPIDSGLFGIFRIQHRTSFTRNSLAL
jgi:hypothetical protein